MKRKSTHPELKERTSREGAAQAFRHEYFERFPEPGSMPELNTMRREHQRRRERNGSE